MIAARPDQTELRRFVVPLYLPWFAMTLGLGVVALALPLWLIDQNLSFTALSVVAAASGIGAFLGGLPASSVISRTDEHTMLLAAMVIIATATVLTATSGNATVLFALQFAVGVGATAMRLAGQAMLTRMVAPGVRGRALSGLGGMRRFGMFGGPLIGGVLLDRSGFAMTFTVAGVIIAAGLLVLVWRGQIDPAPARDSARPDRVSVVAALRRHGRQVFITGLGPAVIMSVRRGRSILIPLIAESLSLDNTTIGLVVAVGTGADLLLFPVAGHLMDRFGRLYAIGPAFGLMAAGLVLLGTVDTATGVMVAGSIIGVGNGLSAGSLLTIGSDLAPEDSPSQFMAAFAAMADLGQISGPLIVGVTADAIGLGTSAVVLGVVLVFGLLWMVATIGETHRSADRPAE